MWFVASVNWAVQYHKLKNLLRGVEIVLPELECDLQNYLVLESDSDSAVYVQAAIAVVSRIAW